MSEQRDNIPEGLRSDTFENASEEWKEFKRTFDGVRKELYQKTKERSQEENHALYARLRVKEKESFASVPDPEKYLAYHIVLSGGTGPISSPKLDFEGEHSLLDFYKKVLEEPDA